MDKDAGNSLMMRTDAAAVALLAMLQKLESDGHIRVAQPPLPSAVLLPELIAYTCMLQECAGREVTESMERLLPLLSPAEDMRIRLGIEGRIKDFAADRAQVPAVYSVLLNFDGMAQEYDGAFYSRMGTDNPGALSEYYLALFEAMWMLSGGQQNDMIFKETEGKLRSAAQGALC